MFRWLRTFLGGHVECQTLDSGEWEQVAAATQPVWRHKGCGDLVLEPYLLAHLQEKHARQVVAQISLTSDGLAEAIAPRGFELTIGQVLGLFKFIDLHLAAEDRKEFATPEAMAARLGGSVVKGPWVH